MTKIQSLRVIALLLMGLGWGCAPPLSREMPTVDATQAPPAQALADCCTQGETMPPAVISVLDGVASTMIPLTQNMRFRAPWLAAQPEAWRVILDAAEPLDILTVASKYHLAGVTSKGVMTHAMVYIGSEAQLRRAGLWSHPDLQPLQQDIRNGARFIEAIDPAVRFAPPDVSLVADSIGLFRPELGRQARSDALGVLIRSIGMPFNFHFRLGMQGCVFCTELVAQAMPSLRLPIREVYGHSLILPDDLAALALRDTGELSFVAYVRGRRGGWDSAPADVLTADLVAAWPPQRR